eukprot:gene10231-12547_t
MVFEGVVAEVLDRFLGSFLQEVTRKQLKIGLFNGNAVLKNIEVKPEAFSAFDLPIAVNRGVVGRLTIKVPWTSLKTESVVVHLQDIYILTSNSNNINISSYDQHHQQQQQQQYDTDITDNQDDSITSGEKFLKFLKMDKKKKSKDQQQDENLDQPQQQQQEEQSNKKKKDTFKEKLITKIINNVQVIVENVHIRYEDRNNDRDIAIGICLDRLYVQSADNDWKPTFIDSNSNVSNDVLNKLADVLNFSVYLDHDQPSMKKLSTKDLQTALRDSIPTSKDSKGHHMLLQPLSVNLKLKIHQEGSILQNISKIEIESVIDEIGLSLEPQQYYSLLFILESLSEFVHDFKEEKATNKSAFQSLLKKTISLKDNKQKSSKKDKQQQQQEIQETNSTTTPTKKEKKEREKKEKKEAKEKSKLEKEEKKKKKKEKRLSKDKLKLSIPDDSTTTTSTTITDTQNISSDSESDQTQYDMSDFGEDTTISSSSTSAFTIDEPVFEKVSKDELKKQLYDTIDYQPSPPNINTTSTTTSTSTTIQINSRIIIVNILIKTIHIKLMSDDPKENGTDSPPLIYGDISGISVTLTKKSDQLELQSQLKSIKLSGLWVQNDQFPDMISSSTLDDYCLSFKMSISQHQQQQQTPSIQSPPLSPQKRQSIPKRISISIDIKPIYFVLNSTAILRYLKLITPEHQIDLSGFSRKRSSNSGGSKNIVELSIIAQSPTVILPINNNFDNNNNNNNNNDINNCIFLLDLGQVSMESISGVESSKILPDPQLYKSFQITTTNIKSYLTRPPEYSSSSSSPPTINQLLQEEADKINPTIPVNKIQRWCNNRSSFERTLFETSISLQLHKRISQRPGSGIPKVIIDSHIPLFTTYFSPFSFYHIRMVIVNRKVSNSVGKSRNSTPNGLSPNLHSVSTTRTTSSKVILKISTKGFESLMMMQNNQLPLCRFLIKAIDFELEKKTPEMMLEFFVESMEIHDVTNNNNSMILPQYKKFLSTLDESKLLLTFKYQINRATGLLVLESDFNCIQFTMLPEFLDKIQEYVLDLLQFIPGVFSKKKHQPHQFSIDSASRSPKVKKRIKLKVSMEAPHIILPAGPMSLNQIHLDLGQLEIENELIGQEMTVFNINLNQLSILVKTELSSKILLDRFGFNMIMKKLLIEEPTTTTDQAKLSIQFTIINDILFRITQQDTLILLNILFNVLDKVKTLKIELKGLKNNNQQQQQKIPISSPRLSIAGQLRKSTSSPLKLIPKSQTTTTNYHSRQISNNSPTIGLISPRVLISQNSMEKLPLEDISSPSPSPPSTTTNIKLKLLINVGSIKIGIEEIGMLFFVHDLKLINQVGFNGTSSSSVSIGKIYLLYNQNHCLPPNLDIDSMICERDTYQQMISLKDQRLENTLEIQYSSLKSTNQSKTISIDSSLTKGLDENNTIHPFDSEIKLIVRQVQITLSQHFLLSVINFTSPILGLIFEIKSKKQQHQQSQPQQIDHIIDSPKRITKSNLNSSHRTLKKENSLIIPFINGSEVESTTTTTTTKKRSLSIVVPPLQQEKIKERIKVYIHVESPQVLIMFNEKDHILVNLGKIQLENVFYSLPLTTTTTTTNISYEHMKIQLSNLFVETIRSTNDSQDIIAHLLEDVSFTLSIDIVEDYNQELADLQIPIQKLDIHCKSISFMMTENDYSFMLDIFVHYYQLLLGVKNLRLKRQQFSSGKIKTTKKKSSLGKTEINIGLDELRFSIFNRDGPLAMLQMNDLGAYISMLSGSTVNIKSHLRSVRLSDSRIDSGSQFLDLFCSKNNTTFEGPLKDSTTNVRGSSNNNDLPLISANIEISKPNNSIDITSVLDRPRIYISPAIVFLIVTFITVPQTSFKQQIKKLKEGSEIVQNSEVIKSSLQPKVKRSINITSQISKLKVLLVENPNSQISNLVIAKLSMDAEYKDSLGCNRIIGCNVQGFQMFSFRHSIANVSSSRAASLIDPVNMNFKVNILTAKSAGSSGKGSAKVIELDVSFDAFNFFLSYHDSLLLALIAGQLKKTFPNLKGSSSGGSKKLKKSKGNSMLMLRVHAPQLAVTFINDYMDQNLPLLDFSLFRINFLMEGIPGDQLTMNLDAKIIADYFNINKMTFEPLIENWEFQFKFIKSSKSPLKSIQLKSDQYLNINFTYGFAHSILSTYHSIQYDLKSTLKLILNLFKTKKFINNNNLNNNLNNNNNSISIKNVTPNPSSNSLLRSMIYPKNQQQSLSNSYNSQFSPLSSMPTSPLNFHNPQSSLSPIPNLDGANNRSISFLTSPSLNSPRSRKGSILIPHQQPVIKSSPLLQSISIRKLTSSFHPYWIINRTGIEMEYIVKSDGSIQQQRDQKPTILEVAQKQPLLIDSKSLLSVKKTRDFRGYKEESAVDQGPQIVLKLFGQKSTCDPLPIGKVGCKLIQLDGKKLIFEVGWNEDGSKLITIRSDICIKNSTTLNLEINFVATSKGTLTPSKVRNILFPGEEFPIPLQFLNCNRYLSIIPLENSTEYKHVSDQTDIIPLEDQDLNNLYKIIACKSIGNHHPPTTNRLINLVISSSKHQYSKKKSNGQPNISEMITTLNPDDLLSSGSKDIQNIITILPPLVMENLLPCPIRLTPLIDDGFSKSATITLESCEQAPIYIQDPRNSVEMIISGIPGFPDQTHQLVDCDQHSKPMVKEKIRITDHPMEIMKPLNIYLSNREDIEGIRKLSLYSVYWIINKTGLPMIFEKPKLIPLTKEAKIPQMLSTSKNNNSGQNSKKDCTIDTMILYSSDRLRIKISNSDWSNIFSLDTVGAAGTVITCDSMAQESSFDEFNFKASISLGKNKLQRTKMVTINFQYLLINDTNQTIYYRQASSSTTQCKTESIEAGTSKPFHWQNRYNIKFLQIKFDQSPDYGWSSPFSIDDIGEFTIKSRNPNTLHYQLGHVEIQDHDSHSTIQFYREEDTSNPPFRIENNTPKVIRYHQIGCNFIDTLLPYGSCDYVWDDLMGTRILNVEIWNSHNESSGSTMKCNLMKIKSFKPVKIGVSTIYGYMKVDGPTRVLVLSTEQQFNGRSDTESLEIGKLDVQLQLPRIGISVINSLSKELIYLSLNDISFFFSKSNIYSRLELIVSNIQIDNQLWHTDYPVLFFHISPKNEDGEQDPKPFLHFSFIKNEENKDGLIEKSSDLVGILLEVIGISFALERTPICLNALIWEHPFLSERSFGSRIKSHYMYQTINQLYKVIGSSDTIGNPVGLFNHLGTGVKDFFYEPALGLIRSPKDFGKGLAKGSISLLKNSVYGLFNTLSKITGAMGKGFALLSFDEQYLRQRQRSNQKKAKHVGDGLAFGVKGLGRGIFDGVTGVVQKPIEGAMKNGIEGFAKGIVQGVVGVGVKPVVGVLDLATRTTEGIRNTTGLFKDKFRIRPPRCFGKDQLLIEYNFDLSEGKYILEKTFKGLFKNWSATFENIKNVEIVAEGLLLNFEQLQKIMIIDYRNHFIIPTNDHDQILQLCLFIRDEIRKRTTIQ